MFNLQTYCTADIETTAIPSTGILEVDAIHCISVKSGDKPTLMYTSRFLPVSNYGGTLKNALEVINSHDYVIGHNFIGFDMIVIENLLGEITATVIDTMILSKLIYTKDEILDMDYQNTDMPTNMYGSFSLAAFGLRLGFPKDSYSDWSKLTIEMCNYCTTDSEVTYRLYQTLLGCSNYPNQTTVDLEHEVAYLVAQQVHYGFYFDTEKARLLQQKLMYEKLSIEIRLSKTFKPMFLANGPVVVPAKARRTKQYIPDTSYRHPTALHYVPRQYHTLKNGKVKLRAYSNFNWTATPHRIAYSYYTGEYQKLTLTKFDAGSRHKIRHWLKTMYRFEFSTFTEKGTPKVEGEELSELGDYGVDLRRYLKIVKDLSQLRGLIEAVRPDSTVTSRIDTNGTVTGRFTSSSVNLNQIPSAKEFRELFTAPEGWTFVGTDFGGQENVNLAEALYPFDNGRLDSINTSGDKDLKTDLHSLNAVSCGVSRTDAKPLWFGFLYGSSSTLTGYTLLGKKEFTDYTDLEWQEATAAIEKRLTPPTEEGIQFYPVKSGQAAVYVPYTDQLVKQAIYGKQVQTKLVQSTDGLSELIKKLEQDAKSTGNITTLGGRAIPVDSPHKCLNYFCQGQGGEAMKHYIRTIHADFREAGLMHGRDFKHQATIYDEIDMIVRDEHVEAVKAILHSGYAKISRQLNMQCTYTGEVLVGSNWAECH